MGGCLEERRSFIAGAMKNRIANKEESFMSQLATPRNNENAPRSDEFIRHYVAYFRRSFTCRVATP